MIKQLAIKVSNILAYVTSSIDEEKYSYQLDLNTSLRPNNKKMPTDKKQSKYTNTLINLKIFHNIWDFKNLVKFIYMYFKLQHKLSLSGQQRNPKYSSCHNEL